MHSRISALRLPVRAILYLFWVYSLASSMLSVFVQVFIYQRFESVSTNVVATMLMYTGIMLGFCLSGAIMAARGSGMRKGFPLSFILIGLSVLYFLNTTTGIQALAAMFLWGAGQGVFWLAVNTYELSETIDEERDFYASIRSAGSQVVSLVGPALATALIWLSGSVLHAGTFTLLFITAPAVLFLGLFWFGVLPEYHPRRIRRIDVTHFFVDRKNRMAQVHTFGLGIQNVLGLVVPPLAALAILGTALNVGFYSVALAVVSTAAVVLLASYRTRGNRLRIYGYLSAVLAAATAAFGYVFDWWALVVYTAVSGVFSPLMTVSAHVVELRTMEMGRDDSDFFAMMLLRELAFWVWRIFGGFLFLILVGVSSGHGALSLGLYILAGAFLVAYLGAVLFVRAGG